MNTYINSFLEHWDSAWDSTFLLDADMFICLMLMKNEFRQCLMSLFQSLMKVYWELNAGSEGGGWLEGWARRGGTMTHQTEQDTSKHFSQLWARHQRGEGIQQRTQRNLGSCHQNHSVQFSPHFSLSKYRWNLGRGMMGRVSTGSISHPPPPINMSHQGGRGRG